MKKGNFCKFHSQGAVLENPWYQITYCETLFHVWNWLNPTSDGDLQYTSTVTFYIQTSTSINDQCVDR